MPLPERLRSFGRMLLMLFILASAAFLSALTAMRIAIEGRQVKMPNVIGQKVIEAEHALSPDGLGLRIEDRVFSDYPEGVIVRQSPPSGLRVKVGERAHVVVSLGPQRVMIPDLRSASLRTARIQLLRDGLQMGETSSLFLTGSTADTVMMQTPPAGALDAASPRVDILVSMGDPSAAWVMPDVTGLLEPAAAQRLDHAGLKNLKIVNQPPPEADAPATPSGAIPASSSPSPLPDGFARFSNNPAAPATTSAVPSNFQPGTVLAQIPAAGSQVETSTQIELRVAQ